MLKLLIASLLFTGCAGMLPTQTIDGVAIYIRGVTEVNEYCLTHVTADQVRPGLAPSMAGCYVPADHLIMVVPERPEVLYHELRHAQGWKHRGPCISSQAEPDGMTPDGTPCEWYR
jgi:hypothetical protein